jgi:hypothetical protein
MLGLTWFVTAFVLSTSFCTVELQGSSYDLTNFDMKGHKSIVLGFCGRDVTEDFKNQHHNDPAKLRVLQQYLKWVPAPQLQSAVSGTFCFGDYPFRVSRSMRKDANGRIWCWSV